MVDLKTYADQKYCGFQKKIIVTKYTLLGVRVPILRRIAKGINYDEYMQTVKLYYYEDYLLYSMIIVKEPNTHKRLELIKDYIKYIDC